MYLYASTLFILGSASIKIVHNQQQNGGKVSLTSSATAGKTTQRSGTKQRRGNKAHVIRSHQLATTTGTIHTGVLCSFELCHLSDHIDSAVFRVGCD